MPQPTSTIITSTDGARLHTQTWTPDDKPRAVLGIVHGWSDHGGRYDNVVEALMPHAITVTALDLRGHGKSDGQRGHIESWAYYRGDIHRFVKTLAPFDVPAFLMGHSMGGLAVMDYAVHFPEQALRGLVLSSPFLAQANTSPVMTVLGRVLSRVAPNLSLDPGASSDTLSRDASVVAAYNADPLVHKRATPRFGAELEATQAFVLANLDGVRYPTALFYGSADGLVPPDVTRSSFPSIGAVDKTRYEVAGGYHELFNDLDKDATLSDLAAWLEARL